MDNPYKFKAVLKKVLEELEEFLLEKNKAYGNSALDPIRIFSKADTTEQLDVRIDDKLSRIAKGTKFNGDNDELDLTGYLILKMVHRKTRE